MNQELQHEILVDLFKGPLIRDTEHKWFIVNYFNDILNKDISSKIIIGQLSLFKKMINYMKAKDRSINSKVNIIFSFKTEDGDIVQSTKEELVIYLETYLNE